MSYTFGPGLRIEIKICAARDSRDGVFCGGTAGRGCTEGDRLPRKCSSTTPHSNHMKDNSFTFNDEQLAALTDMASRLPEGEVVKTPLYGVENAVSFRAIVDTASRIWKVTAILAVGERKRVLTKLVLNPPFRNRKTRERVEEKFVSSHWEFQRNREKIPEHPHVVFTNIFILPPAHRLPASAPHLAKTVDFVVVFHDITAEDGVPRPRFITYGEGGRAAHNPAFSLPGTLSQTVLDEALLRVAAPFYQRYRETGDWKASVTVPRQAAPAFGGTSILDDVHARASTGAFHQMMALQGAAMEEAAMPPPPLAEALEEMEGTAELAGDPATLEEALPEDDLEADATASAGSQEEAQVMVSASPGFDPDDLM